MANVDVRTSGRPTSIEVEAIEEALMSAAFDEFAEHGYAGASLTRIVAQARMSKTTLYSRYPSKEALFKNVMRQQIDAEKPYEILCSCAEPFNIADRLERFAIEILNFSFEPRMFTINRVIVTEVHRFPALAQAAEEKLQRGISRVTHFLQASSATSPHPIANAEAIAEAFIHMIRGWYLQCLFGGTPSTDEQVRIWARKAVRALVCAAPGWE
jgi:AcrR family transcriptional regulator